MVVLPAPRAAIRQRLYHDGVLECPQPWPRVLPPYLVVVIVGGTLIAGLIVGAQRADDSGPVDLIIHNAKVYAADDLGSIADAVAIRGNKILKVGSEREIMRYRRPQTTVIDAKGAAVLPGFDDAHVSLVAGGLARDGVQLFGAATLDEIQQRVDGMGRRRTPTPPGSPVGGWSYDVFADLPLRAQLDAAVGDRPAQLLSHDGQALWLNTQGARRRAHHQADAATRSTASSSAIGAASRPAC